MAAAGSGAGGGSSGAVVLLTTSAFNSSKQTNQRPSLTFLDDENLFLSPADIMQMHKT